MLDNCIVVHRKFLCPAASNGVLVVQERFRHALMCLRRVGTAPDPCIERVQAPFCRNRPAEFSAGRFFWTPGIEPWPAAMAVCMGQRPVRANTTPIPLFQDLRPCEVPFRHSSRSRRRNLLANRASPIFRLT